MDQKPNISPHHRFGHLKALKQNGENCWQCLCDCGQLETFHFKLLISGKKARCSSPKCLFKTESETHNLPLAILQAYKSYEKNAVLRDYEFSLTQEEFESLIFQPCSYCSREPSGYLFKEIKRHGIDRVDNAEGYFAGNVVTCCWDCNHRKSDYTVDGIDEKIEALKLEQQRLRGIKKMIKKGMKVA